MERKNMDSMVQAYERLHRDYKYLEREYDLLKTELEEAKDTLKKMESLRYVIRLRLRKWKWEIKRMLGK